MPRGLQQVAPAPAFWLVWISGLKYDALARRMGRPESVPDSSARRRFVIIQVDALAHEYLQQALDGGHFCR